MEELKTESFSWINCNFKLCLSLIWEARSTRNLSAKTVSQFLFLWLSLFTPNACWWKDPTLFHLLIFSKAGSWDAFGASGYSWYPLHLSVASSVWASIFFKHQCPVRKRMRTELEFRHKEGRSYIVLD